MGDAERLAALQYLVDAKRLGCRTASLKISSKVHPDHGVLFRISGGSWQKTLRDAIDAYCDRWHVNPDSMRSEVVR